jgi:hypothetical protein
MKKPLGSVLKGSIFTRKRKGYRLMYGVILGEPISLNNKIVLKVYMETGKIKHYVKKSVIPNIVRWKIDKFQKEKDDIFVNSQKTCTICFENMDDNDHVLVCKHKFHKKCLMEWYSFDKMKSCPVCRNK